MFRILIKILLFPVMILLALCEAICAAVAHASGTEVVRVQCNTITEKLSVTDGHH